MAMGFALGRKAGAPKIKSMKRIQFMGILFKKNLNTIKPQNIY